MQVECQDKSGEDSAEHDERQPSLEKRCPAHMFAMDERECAQIDHVPGCTVVIAHQVQSHCNMGVAIVKTEIVRP